MIKFDGYLGSGYAVCERCMVRCERWYKDDSGRTQYIICPICNNGDPQTDQDECGLSEDDLESNLIFWLFLKGIDLDGFRTSRLRAMPGAVRI